MMADRIDWTQGLGSAFANQPADVMSSIQRMRATAQAAGTLVSTPQQQVVIDQGAIRILPAQPNVVYVPIYDPAVVYVRHREPMRNTIAFTGGFSTGGWLNLDVDWHDHYVASGVRWDRDDRYDRRGDHPHDYHPGPAVVGPVHPWVRDSSRPIMAMPPRYAGPEHRGWGTESREHGDSHGFGDYEHRQDAERERARGHESMEHGHESMEHGHESMDYRH